MPVIARIARDDFHDPELALSQQKLRPRRWRQGPSEAKLWHKIKSLGWKFIWWRLWRHFLCCGKYLFVAKTRDNTCDSRLTQTNLTKQKTRIDYPRQLCGRWWLRRLRIIKFAFLILKYLGSDHNKDSCEVPENPEEYFPLQSTSSEKQ